MKHDAKTFIHNIETVKPTKSDVLVSTSFGKNGKKLTKGFSESDVFIRIEDDKYFVRINKKYQLCNPNNDDSLKADKALVKGTKNKTYTMMLVSKDCYDHYKKFLETGYVVQLKLAQRIVDEQENKVKYGAVMTKNHSQLNDEMSKYLSEIKDANS